MAWAVRLRGEVRDGELRQWDEPWWLMQWADAECARSVQAEHAQVFEGEAEAVLAIARTPWVGELVEV